MESTIYSNTDCLIQITSVLISLSITSESESGHCGWNRSSSFKLRHCTPAGYWAVTTTVTGGTVTEPETDGAPCQSDSGSESRVRLPLSGIGLGP
jgi:hypothetical protein